MEQPYEKLTDTPQRRQCPRWLWPWSRSVTASASQTHHTTSPNIQAVRLRMVRRLKDINLKLSHWEANANKHRDMAITYDKCGKRSRAQAEAKLYINQQRNIDTLIAIQTKLRLLRQEMDKAQTVTQCVDMLQTGIAQHAQLLERGMSVDDVDRMMVRWETQLKQANDTQRALTRPIQHDTATNAKGTYGEDTSVPDDDVLALLASWHTRDMPTTPALVPGASVSNRERDVTRHAQMTLLN